MNWDDYRYFLAVARTGQLSQAGRILGVDHTTVARRTKALESRLKTKLFDRSPRGYALTPAGQRLLPVAEQLERDAERARDSVAGAQAPLSGRVRIGVPEGVGAYVVVRAAQELCEMHGGLRLELVALPQRFSLSRREADFAIAVSPPQSGRLKVRKIADYKLHLYGARDYLERFPPVRSVEDLKQMRGIAYVPDLIFDKVLDYIPLIDPALEPRLTSTSVHVQLQAALNGAGVCILHDFMARHHERLVRVLENKISFTRSFWLVVHEDYADIERIRLSASHVVKRMREILKRDG
ncbi:MAG: LysR family transcriptional regulator [Alphaproteobacteria bacterium]|nr:MAG: LysR family transcriptional regulator [Alphaproteobacteria bacterium]